MKAAHLFYLFCLYCIRIKAQNLIPNGSFEQFTSCPGGDAEFHKCTNWIIPAGTPDYFHACYPYSSLGGPGVPYNFSGYQPARTGQAYAGILVHYFLNPNYREYMEAHLTAPLIAGGCYYFEMYVNKANLSKYMCTSIGVCFSDTLLDSLPPVPISLTAQIQNPITNTFDTLNWILVDGYYTAQGGEEYITIGNFYPDSLSNVMVYEPTSPYPKAFILIDDVSLTLCTGLEEFNQLNITLAPNPFTNSISITTTDNSSYTFTLTDITGRHILTQNLQGTHEVNTATLNKGIYLATIRKKDKVVVRKILKE